MRPPPIVRIANGTFYRHHPTSTPSAHRRNPPLFPGLSLEIPSFSSSHPVSWCVVGPSLSGKTTLLHVLTGRLLCDPPSARSFPWLSDESCPARLRTPRQALQYVGFGAEQQTDLAGGGGHAQAAYLSARYESRREITDFSLRDYLLGNTQLNPFKDPGAKDDDDAAALERHLAEVVRDLKLDRLLDLPVTFLSNGQGRRARIARALLLKPAVLLLDEPFMGLDPPTVAGLSPLLGSLAERRSPRLVLSARPQDPVPSWVTHMVYLRKDCQVESMGPKELVLDGLKKYVQGVAKGERQLPLDVLSQQVTQTSSDHKSTSEPTASSKASHETRTSTEKQDTEPLVEFDGCRVRYGDKTALGNWTQHTPSGPRHGLVWTVRRGERWGVFGPNGSGKTTVVSLLASDHPQAYSLPLRLFGRARLPEAGASRLLPPLTYWDVQSRIGHSSPEVHQHMPRRHSARRVVESAWASTFGAPPRLGPGDAQRVDAALRWFEPELRPRAVAAVDDTAAPQQGESVAWADECFFGELSFSAQRVLLFLRAVIKAPDIVVLDEAFSGMDDAVRDKCMRFLERGDDGDGSSSSSSGSSSGSKGLSERQALICIAHVKEEVPDCVRDWMCLPEPNTGLPARFGRFAGPLREDERRWLDVWGV